MDKDRYDTILDEAMLLVLEDAECFNVGVVRLPGQSPQRVSPEVWLAVRAIRRGLDIAADRALADKDSARARKLGL